MEDYKFKSYIFSVLLAWAFGTQSICCAKSSHSDSNVHIWSGQKHFYKSGTLAAKVGSTVKLNCTLSNYSQPTSILWRINQLPIKLTRSEYNSSIVQSIVDNVTWSLNGSVFWCGYRRSVNGSILEEGIEVTLIVGDLPSPPRTPTHRIYGIRLYEVNIFWKPALYTGGLPAYYQVSYIPCHNQSHCPYTPVYGYCQTPHINGRKNYNCKMLRENMALRLQVEELCDVYRFVMVTVNAVGESSAVTFIVYAGFGGDKPFLPTPLPPSKLQAVAQGSWQIRVQWETRKYDLYIYNPKYIVLYHDMEDKHGNMTKAVHKIETLTLLESDGIKPYTRYKVYLVTQISYGNKSQTSDTIGPVSVKTDEGEPYKGPTITRIRSIKYANDTHIRNVTLEWKEPTLSSWQGKPLNIVVYYKNTKKTSYIKQVIPVMHGIPSKVTLTGLKTKDYYVTYARLCNHRNCGSMGPEKTITPLSDKDPDVQNLQNPSKTIYIALGSTLGGLGLTVIVLFIYFLRKWWHIKRLENMQTPLEVLVPSDQLSPEVEYEDPANPGPRPDYAHAVIV